MKDFAKAEDMFRLALNGYEKSLGKDHEGAKRCARNLARLYLESVINNKEKMRAIIARYPYLALADVH